MAESVISGELLLCSAHLHTGVLIGEILLSITRVILYWLKKHVKWLS